MPKRKNGKKLVKIFPFKSLVFREPFSEKHAQRGSVAFFSGIYNLSGVVVMQYRNGFGKSYIKIGRGMDLRNNARNLYLNLKRFGHVEEVRFAFIPERIDRAKGLADSIWQGYLNHSLSHDYAKLEPWLKGKRKQPNLSKLQFAPPFVVDNGVSRWNFLDFKDRSGVYIIKENGIVVYVGKSVRHISNVLKNHFYPYPQDRKTKHYRVTFYETKNVHKYECAIIEVPIACFRSWQAVSKAVEELETALIRHFNPKLNVKGKVFTSSKEEWWQGKATNFTSMPSVIFDANRIPSERLPVAPF